MNDFTFLTVEQCFGSNKLDILKKRGTEAAITDFSILLGGYVSRSYHINNDSSLEGRTGVYWTKSASGYQNGYVYEISDHEMRDDLGVSAGNIKISSHRGSPSFTVLGGKSNSHERKEREKSKRWCA